MRLKRMLNNIFIIFIIAIIVTPSVVTVALSQDKIIYALITIIVTFLIIASMIGRKSEPKQLEFVFN